MARKTTNLLAGLPNEAVILSCESHASADELHITFPGTAPLCPDCSSISCTLKDYIPFRVRHTPNIRRSIILSFTCSRYKCKDCGKTFTAKPYWLHDRLRMTKNLHLAITLDLAELLSMSAIARNNCVPVSVVQSVLKQLPFPKPQRLPQTLCIDEFKGDSGAWDPTLKKWNHKKYQCSIADGDSGTITDILPGIDSARLSKYFMEYSLEERRRVRYFCCDMHNAYPSLAKHCFPDAVICIDLFHVVNRLNAAVDEVRRRLQNLYRNRENKEHYERLKHSAYLLKTAKNNQKTLWGASFSKRKDRLDAALSVSNDMKEVYDMLQDFHAITATPGYTDQREMLSEWILKYHSSEVLEVLSAVNTIRHWRGYIQNSFRYGKSNGSCEGLNNKIKVLKRICFGVHDFESFRKRILLSCGCVHWDTDTSKYAMTDIGKEGVLNG